MVLKMLEFKEILKTFCEKYNVYVKIVLKLLLSVTVLFMINSNIGYNRTIDNVVILLGISVVCALVPDPVMIMMICLVTFAEMYSFSLIIAIPLVCVYLIIYFMYVKYVPMQAFVILCIPFMYIMNIHYAIPFICGLFMSPVSIISAAFGVFMYYLFSSITQLVSVYNGEGISDTVNIYNVIVDDLINNKYMFFTMVVFAITILIIYIIRRQKFAHASYIAIVAGLLITFISFLMATAFLENSADMVGVLAGNTIGGCIAVVAQFFRMTLDYSGTKRVQFEDDEYYYYVKAVPKYTVSVPDKQVVRIHAQTPTGNTANLQDVVQKIYDENK